MASHNHLGEQFIGYHHTDKDAADQILKNGYSSEDPYVYFFSSPDPSMRYGESVVELSVDPTKVQTDPHHNYESRQGSDLPLSAPSSAVTPLKVHDFTGNRKNKWSGKDHISEDTHEWDGLSNTFIQKK